MEILISVIIPTFNRAELVKQALDSVCQQTYSQWEAVVVDDGSADETKNELAKYQRREPRIRVLSRSRLPKGAPTCRNIGLAAARGAYVVFLDSDDLLAPNCLAQRAGEIQKNPDADFIIFQSQLFYERPHDSRLLTNTENGESDLARFLRGDAVWLISGPIWKKTAVEKLGGFDERLSCWQDIEIHQRALMQQLKYVKRLDAAPDVFVRRHQQESISQQGFNSRETVGSIFTVYDKAVKALGQSPVREIKSGLRYMLAHAVQYALDNRYPDLAAAGIAAGRNDEVLNSPQRALWNFARFCYVAHARGFRGCARLGKCLLQPFQPRISVGTHSISAH